jgi:hypothetical protein
MDPVKEEKVESRDTLISFDVVSLFTKISSNETIQVINEVVDPETTRLVEFCLRLSSKDFF